FDPFDLLAGDVPAEQPRDAATDQFPRIVVAVLLYERPIRIHDDQTRAARIDDEKLTAGSVERGVAQVEAFLQALCFVHLPGELRLQRFDLPPRLDQFGNRIGPERINMGRNPHASLLGLDSQAATHRSWRRSMEYTRRMSTNTHRNPQAEQMA